MVCKLCKSEGHFVNLATKSNSNCRGLLFIYGGITVTDGYLCRKCNRQINTLHSHTLSFRLLCQKYNGPPQDTQKVIKSKPLQPICQNRQDQPPESPPAKKVKARTTQDEHNYFHHVPKPSIKKTTKVLPTTNRHVSAQNLSSREYQKIRASLETRNVDLLAESLLESKILHEATVKKLAAETSDAAARLGRRKCPKSSLMDKNYLSMKEFSWKRIVDDHAKMFPTLTEMLLAISLGTHHMQNQDKVNAMTPKIGLIMAILLQSRHHDLSLVQRTISTILYNNLCDQKVSWLS